MMMRNTLRFLYVFLFGLLSIIVKAQPQLPDIAAVSQQGVNYISWTNPYDGLKAIAVQRSTNGQNNFRSIGYVKDLKKGAESMIDTKPESGVCYYRLLIVFNSGLNWYSNVTKIEVEVPENEEITVVKLAKEPMQNMSSIKVTYDAPEVKNVVIEPLPNNDKFPQSRKPQRFIINEMNEVEMFNLIRSEHIYYNTASGFVQIEIPTDTTDSVEVMFTIDFFDNRNYRVIRIPDIHQHSFMLDKRNFQHKGLYRFELKKNDELVEEGYILMN
jgi:hypothetical protein